MPLDAFSLARAAIQAGHRVTLVRTGKQEALRCLLCGATLHPGDPVHPCPRTSATASAPAFERITPRAHSTHLSPA